MKTLLELLEIASPSGYTVRARAKITDLLTDLGAEYKIDAAGNIHVDVGNGSKTLFLSHFDCVHNSEPMLIELDENTGVIRLAEECKQRALGADDKAGVRCMLHMIKHSVAGHYTFCIDEEIGCIGSQKYADNVNDGQFLRAISFDRRGRSSVITEMAEGACCSTEFASALCEQLGMGFSADPTGSVTDSMSFANVVDNYTNISVGYMNEHGESETLFAGWLINNLLPALLEVRWDDLPTNRRDDGYYRGMNRLDYGYQSDGDYHIDDLMSINDYIKFIEADVPLSHATTHTIRALQSLQEIVDDMIENAKDNML